MRCSGKNSVLDALKWVFVGSSGKSSVFEVVQWVLVAGWSRHGGSSLHSVYRLNGETLFKLGETIRTF